MDLCLLIFTYAYNYILLHSTLKNQSIEVFHFIFFHIFLFPGDWKGSYEAFEWSIKESDFTVPINGLLELMENNFHDFTVPINALLELMEDRLLLLRSCELMEKRLLLLRSCDFPFLSYSVPIIQRYDLLSLTNSIYLLLEKC